MYASFNRQTPRLACRFPASNKAGGPTILPNSDRPRALYADLRARKVAQVSESLALSGSRSAHQMEIWQDISEKCQRMGADAPTRAMADLYDRFDSKLDEAIDALAPSQGEAGAIVAINGSVRGLDVFDRTDTYLKLFPKLLGGYAVDAFDRGLRDSEERDQSEPRELLDALRAQIEVSSSARIWRITKRDGGI